MSGQTFWVQTVCKSYKLTSNVAANKERVKNTGNNQDYEHGHFLVKSLLNLRSRVQDNAFKKVKQPFGDQDLGNKPFVICAQIHPWVDFKVAVPMSEHFQDYYHRKL